MVVKRPTERVSAPAKAATGSKRPRAGTLSPVDPAFMPTAEGRAHGSSSTPLKAILDDYAEQQQQLTAASGSDDGMVGLHIGFDIPDAEPVGAAAVAQPVAPAAPVAPEIDQGDTTDLEQDGPAQADDEDAPTMTTTDILADQLPAVSPPADLTAEMVAGLKVTDLKAAMTVRAVAFRAEDNKADLVARLTKHVKENPNFCAATDGLRPFKALTPVEVSSGPGRKRFMFLASVVAAMASSRANAPTAL